MPFRQSVVLVKCRFDQVSFRSSVVRSTVVQSTVVAPGLQTKKTINIKVEITSKPFFLYTFLLFYCLLIGLHILHFLKWEEGFLYTMLLSSAIWQPSPQMPRSTMPCVQQLWSSSVKKTRHLPPRLKGLEAGQHRQNPLVLCDGPNHYHTVSCGYWGSMFGYTSNYS